MSLRIGPSDDLAACQALRRAVFIAEQGVPADVEQDGRDRPAHHILAWLDGVPVGTARLLVERGNGKIGRVCVLKDQRKKGIGAALIRAGVDHLRSLGLARAELGAQTHALDFYTALGFSAFGPEFEDAGGQPHRMMRRDL